MFLILKSLHAVLGYVHTKTIVNANVCDDERVLASPKASNIGVPFDEGESTTLNLDANPRAQLGRGVHNFGHKSPYTNISSQLGWGVHNFAH